jgi:hypothetical protein
MMFGAITIIKKDTMNFGCIGVTLGLNHPGSNHPSDCGAYFVNTFNGQTNVGQSKRNCLDIIGQIG